MTRTTTKRLEVAGALTAALLLAFGAGPALGTSMVQVTYDLSDASIKALWIHGFVITYANDHPLNGTVSGSMQLLYTSDSSSGMPIRTGPVVLRTFNLRVQDTNPAYTYTFDRFRGIIGFGASLLTGTLHWRLTTPVAGNLTAGGALTGLSGTLGVSGRVHCLVWATFCETYLGLPTQTVTFFYLHGGAFKLAGDPGPFGGAQSTRHTLTGSAPISAPFSGYTYTYNDVTYRYGFFLKSFTNYPTFGNVIVGREVARSPEPGTLGLFSVGVGALALTACAGWVNRERRGGPRPG